MEKFPAKYANTFRSELCAVFRLLNGGFKKETELRTVCTHQTHFYGGATREESYTTSFL